MKKSLLIFGCFIGLAGLFLLSGWQNAALSTVLANVLSRKMGQSWSFYLQILGFALAVTGIGLAFGRQVAFGWNKLAEIIRQVQANWDTVLKNGSGAALDFSDLPIEWPRFNRLDTVILLGFLLFSALYQLARLSSGFPYVLLSSDAANLASVVAANKYPQLFPGDMVLGNPANFRLYSTIHIPLLSFLESLVGNFGLAFRVLLGPHVFLQLFGFYWLGCILFRSRFWGLIFSLMAAAPVPLPVGEVWGIVVDALPRFTFQVILVFLLGLVIRWRSNPRLWYGIMAFAALMAFVHPVSTPIWGASFLVGFWPLLPSEWSFPKRIWQMIKLGLAFAIALIPYLIIYLSYHQGGSSAGGYNLVYTVLTEYFPANIYNMPGALAAFFSMVSVNGLVWFALVGLLLSFLLLPAERRNLSLVVFWMLGLVLVSIFLPWGEQIIEKRFRIVPLQTELVRGIRYLVPLMLVLWIFPLAGLAQRLKNPWLTRGLMALGVVSAVFWMMVNPLQPTGELQKEVACLASGKLVCPTKQEFAQTLVAIKTITPEKSTFVVMRQDWNNGTDIRYLSLRPLVYAYKDRGFLTLSNHTALERWYKLFQLEQTIYRKSTKPDDQRRMAVDFAHKTDAEYLLTDFPYTKDELSSFHLDLVYQNGNFMVLKLNP